jgi:hypothetical protein
MAWASLILVLGGVCCEKSVAWANILVYCTVVIWIRIEMLTIFCCGDAVMHLLLDAFLFEDLTEYFLTPVFWQ